MPRDSTRAIELGIPHHPGFRKEDKTYWCNCTCYCHGIMKELPRRTYTNHRAARQQESEGGPAVAPAVLLPNPRPGAYDGEHIQQPPEQSSPLPQPELPVDDDDRRSDPSGGIPPQDSSQGIPGGMPGSPEGEQSGEAMGGGEAMGRAAGATEDEPESDPAAIVTIEDLKVALAFVERIKTAKLERELLDLGDDPDLQLCVELYITLGNTSQKAYNDAMKKLGRRFEEATFLSYEACRKKVEELTGIIALLDDMCPNSCMAYTGPLAALQHCRHCNEPRYRTVGNKKILRQQFYTIPVGPQLQALMRSIEMARLAQYRQKKTDEVFEKYVDEDGNVNIPIIEDYIHGLDYLPAISNGDIKEGDFLMLSIDGAQLYEHKASDCWIYIWVLMDLPPDMWYKKKFVMPGGFIPGPKKPKNEGLGMWDPLHDMKYLSHPFFIFGTADGPGLAYLNGRNGHNGYMGCRLFCDIPGRRFATHSTTYYPALFKPANHDIPGSNHPDVNISELLNTTTHDRTEVYEERLKHLISSGSITVYKERRKETGISKPSMFSGLDPSHRLDIIGLFPSDLMHLTALNVTNIILDLFRGTADVHAPDDRATWKDWTVLTAPHWVKHGETVENFKRYLSSSIDRPPRNPAKKINSGYKAKEYLTYVFGMLPALLCDILPAEYYTNFCKLVWGVRILTQRAISQHELQSAHAALLDFVVGFERLYVQRLPSRVHFVRQCIHNLIHLGPETYRVGPQNLISQWCMERTIGNLGEEIRQPSNPYKNLSERGLRRAQVNAMISMLDLDLPASLPKGATDLGGGFYLLSPTDRRQRPMTRNEVAAFLDFALDLDSNWQTERGGGVNCTRRGRVRLPTKQIARTAWKEQQKSPDAPLRISRMVKLVEDVLIDGQPTFQVTIAEVAYFFNATINEEEHGLAMVSLCAPPDEEILRHSCNALWVTELESGENMRVIPIKLIKSVVSLLPCPFAAEKYFLLEDLGLDVAYLDSSTFAEDEDEDDMEDE
ncbi:hypothetical protein DFP72DRAFT_1079342 [Ephemerocybe angulata]|uniref:Uncharacterized protein n=1 Tax=Ephemerocybe angulata TaxID=980116 RepID=A0A8H6HDS7_9AGAR|nr:hypothetical protein DFP72DRAFT_1079342 [Tulosesus angulatus]